MYLKMIISGGQTGADEAGLEAAYQAGIATGGFAPKTYRTAIGSNYILQRKYNLLEDSSYNYPPRTLKNAKFADATIRLAYNFGSRGEKLTLKYIKQENKPYLDVDINNPVTPIEVAEWIHNNRFEVINIAGNTNTEDNRVYLFCVNYLKRVFELVKAFSNE